MLNDASTTELLDSFIALAGDWAVLNVQLLQASAIVSNELDPLITDHFTALDTELLQVRAILRKHFKPNVCHITFPQVQGS